MGSIVVNHRLRQLVAIVSPCLQIPATAHKCIKYLAVVLAANLLLIYIFSASPWIQGKYSYARL